MKRTAWLLFTGALAACGAKASPELLQHFQGKTLYTCCNIHYQGDMVTDANYAQGSIIPLGTQIDVKKIGEDSVTFVAGGTKLTVQQLYGKGKEPAKQYFEKVFVNGDRSSMLAKLPPHVQLAIREGRVERGMTRSEVVLSLGFPPIDDNPSPTAPEWTYWYSKGNNYKVKFIDKYVDEVVGSPAPTKGEPVRKLVIRQAAQ
jgi:hypothetical protein